MQDKARFTIVGLGEILWDMLPAGKQLGGAPANFAYHAQALGGRGIAASYQALDHPLGAMTPTSKPPSTWRAALGDPWLL